MIARRLPLLLALGACAPVEGDDADTDSDALAGPAPIDERVDSYVPTGLVGDAPVRLVFLGDSITDGAGAGRESLDYVHLLQENDAAKWPGFDDVDLQTTHPSITEVIDVSQSGATTDSLIASQLPALRSRLGDLPAEGETIVVFTIGGNDAQAALNPFADAHAVVTHALDNLELIVDALQGDGLFATPPAVLATNIYEPTDATGEAEGCFAGFDVASALPELDFYNTGFRALAEEKGFAALDLRGDFLGHGFHHGDAAGEAYVEGDPSLWFADDCIHPNNRGHHELRRLVHAAILGQPLRVVLPEK